MLIDSSVSDSSTGTATTEEKNQSFTGESLTTPKCKKRLSVRWKDIEERGAGDIVTLDEPDVPEELKREQSGARPSSLRKYRRKRSPSPPISLTTKELQEHIQRQERSIRRACKLELKLLNQSKQVRDKRVRMVERLKRLKRKARKAVCNKANRDFLLPPVFSPKKPTLIDMTDPACV